MSDEQVSSDGVSDTRHIVLIVTSCLDFNTHAGIRRISVLLVVVKAVVRVFWMTAGCRLFC